MSHEQTKNGMKATAKRVPPQSAPLTTFLVEEIINRREVHLSRCQVAGKAKDFESVLRNAQQAIRACRKLDHTLRPSSVSDVQSTKEHNEEKLIVANGYAGYALMRLERYSAAVPHLENAIGKTNNAKMSSSGELSDEQKVAKNALRRCYNKLADMDSLSPETDHVSKFPRTAHLFDTGASTSDDIVLTEDNNVLASLCDGKTRVILEEKIDGANLGFSLCPRTGQILAQNRSHFISTGDHAQFGRVNEWIEEHREALCTKVLRDENGIERILYGEWMVARHSIPYHKLPGLFVAFDLFDTLEEKCLSRQRFHDVMKDTGIPVVPVLGSRTFGPYQSRKASKQLRNELLPLLDTKSVFRNDNGTIEGLVMRIDGSDGWLMDRTKLVRSDFIAGCGEGHWMRRAIDKQQVDFEFAQTYLETCCSLTTERAQEAAQEEKKAAALEKPEVLSKEVARARRRAPRAVILMGLPGAGKSTFATRLEASGSWTLINQDNLGRKECERLAARAGRKGRVILDRCNPMEKDRLEWVDALHSPPKGETALVYFATDVEACVEHVKSRLGHPTIPHGRGENVVRQVAKVIEPPTENEKKTVFGMVKVISSYEQADDLLNLWGA